MANPYTKSAQFSFTPLNVELYADVIKRKEAEYQTTNQANEQLKTLFDFQEGLRTQGYSDRLREKYNAKAQEVSDYLMKTKDAQGAARMINKVQQEMVADDEIKIAELDSKLAPTVVDFRTKNPDAWVSYLNEDGTYKQFQGKKPADLIKEYGDVALGPEWGEYASFYNNIQPEITQSFSGWYQDPYNPELLINKETGRKKKSIDFIMENKGLSDKLMDDYNKLDGQTAAFYNKSGKGFEKFATEFVNQYRPWDYDVKQVNEKARENWSYKKAMSDAAAAANTYNISTDTKGVNIASNIKDFNIHEYNKLVDEAAKGDPDAYNKMLEMQPSAEAHKFARELYNNQPQVKEQWDNLNKNLKSVQLANKGELIIGGQTVNQEALSDVYNEVIQITKDKGDPKDREFDFSIGLSDSDNPNQHPLSITIDETLRRKGYNVPKLYYSNTKGWTTDDEKYNELKRSMIQDIKAINSKGNELESDFLKYAQDTFTPDKIYSLGSNAPAASFEQLKLATVQALNQDNFSKIQIEQYDEDGRLTFDKVDANVKGDLLAQLPELIEGNKVSMVDNDGKGGLFITVDAQISKDGDRWIVSKDAGEKEDKRSTKIFLEFDRKKLTSDILSKQSGASVVSPIQQIMGLFDSTTFGSGKDRMTYYSSNQDINDNIIEDNFVSDLPVLESPRLNSKSTIDGVLNDYAAYLKTQDLDASVDPRLANSKFVSFQSAKTPKMQSKGVTIAYGENAENANKFTVTDAYNKITAAMADGTTPEEQMVAAQFVNSLYNQGILNKEDGDLLDAVGIIEGLKQIDKSNWNKPMIFENKLQAAKFSLDIKDSPGKVNGSSSSGNMEPIELKPEIKEKAKSIYDYLLEKGVSREHAIGMLVNIQKESSFNHSISQDFTGRESLGLFQYTGSRAKKLKQAHPDWHSDWKKQIDFALNEDSTKTFLKQKFDSAEAASQWFTKYWERPANAEKEAVDRLKYIKSFNFE